MNLEELYRGYAEGGNERKRSEGLLSQTHWISSLVDFDPKTGKALPVNFTELLRRSCSIDSDEFPKDRFWHLLEHSRRAVTRIMDNLSEEPRRENAYMPIRSVRELDTASFVALSRRPGRNIREKLSDKPYMQAAHHYQSVDTPENQLFKAYVKRIAEILELRKETLESNDPLLPRIKRWLKTDDALSISRWQNLPPNNTLLSHRDYRKIWDSWRWLQAIDDDVNRDNDNYTARCDLKNYWVQLANTYLTEETQFAEMPVSVDWAHFAINPWMKEPVRRRAQAFRKHADLPLHYEPVCVDLARLYPAYACDEEFEVMDDSFVWQEWHEADNPSNDVDICLFESDAFYEDASITTVTAPDLFFSRRHDEESLNIAAGAFAGRLKDAFPTEALVWLTPDCLNEFELVIIRRNINAYYSKAEPLPRSVAAVLEHVDYSEITHEGYSVAIIDDVNGVSSVTVLTASFDPDLLKALPETHGYMWEREIPQTESREASSKHVYCEIAQVDESGTWRNDYNPYGVDRGDVEDVVVADENGHFDLVIGLNASPVVGGLRLMKLQAKAGNRTIWRNRIPELMTPATDENGISYDHYFVSRDDTKVDPVRGRPVPIPQAESFTIPAWREFIPLYQGGEGAAPLEYAAKLTSPDIPYNDEIKCHLKMTYTYGADNPYDLTFIPFDASLREIHVEWRPKAAMSDDSSVGPSYPTPLTWDDLKNQRKPSGDKCDFIEWAEDSSTRLQRELIIPPLLTGYLKFAWKGEKPRRYSFIVHDGTETYVKETSLRKVSCDELTRYSEVYFYVKTGADGRTHAAYVSDSPDVTVSSWRYNAKSIIGLIRRNLFVPYGKVWADGRSLNDDDCPVAFRNDQISKIKVYAGAYHQENVPSTLKTELLSLLCYTGLDFPSELEWEIREEYEKVLQGGVSYVQDRPFGYFLSDLGQPWKLDVLHRLIASTDSRSLEILSQAIWHHPDFIEALEAAEIRAIAEKVSEAIDSYAAVMASKGRRPDTEFVHNAMSLTRCLELLLGLLMSRNSKRFEEHLTLQPNQAIAQTLLKQVQMLERTFGWRPESFHTRIEMDLPSTEGSDSEEHLLEALRLYLSGDERINAIKITGVSDNA
ncbi:MULTISPECIES: DUF2357 domain-containing protein [unclassified Collinsella]|uniref:DUF2357 domain-containing protein n=1 Tax=unclassified Collinsella TaxID=2637548 RepID=UPI003F8A6029